MRKLVVTLLVLLVIVGLGWAWIERSRDKTTAVDTSAAKQIAGSDTTTVDAGERPESGTDSFDALGGASHEFPKQVYAVVKLDAEDSCAWTWTMPFVNEHIEERRFCTSDGFVVESGFDRTTEFIGHRQTSAYECSDGAWRIPDPKVKQPWTWTCTEERGGLVTYTGRIVGDEQLDVDGSRTTAIHVRVDGVQKDKSKGTEQTELWLLPGGLPARFTSTRTLTVPTPIGKMTSNEQWDYRIDSLEPTEQ
jgi:hypothetical protein